MNVLVIIALDQMAGLYRFVDLPVAFRRSHPVYHHDLRPSVRATAEWGPRRYELITNSLGFRDGAIRQVELESDRRRVLLMGDSFAEGVGVTWEESFAGRLAASAGDEAEVLNAGVVGYAPTTYRLKTEWFLNEVGLDVDALVVFIDMSDVLNELIYEVWEPSDDGSPSEPPGFFRKFVHRSLVVRAYDRWRGRNRQDVDANVHGMPFAGDLDADIMRDPAFHQGELWNLDYKYAQRGMDDAAAQMARLADLCAERGIRLSIVVYPWRVNIRKRELDHPQVGLWRAFAAERNLEFLNLFPVFIHEGGDPEDTINRYFIRGDEHWNADGHALVAREVARLLGLRPPVQ